MDAAAVYIPIDRRQAMAGGTELPDRTHGSALFADISGFTPLTEALTAQLGRQRAAEELTHQLNQVYDALITQVHRYRGSVISFVGDAITCWFDDDDPAAQPWQAGYRAATCALAMQTAMAPFASVEVAPRVTSAFAIKVGIALGPARRFGVGDPEILYVDVLAGDTLRQMALAEGLAQKGEVLLAPSAAAHLGDAVKLKAWRTHPDTGQAFAILDDIVRSVAPNPWPPLPPDALSGDQVRPWILPAVYQRLQTDQDRFSADLRPAVSLFLRFSDLDYDQDEQAGAKLDAYVRWVQRIVNRYEGSLIQLTIGDKGSYLYAAFGAPVAHADDAVRGVMASLELLVPPVSLDFITSTQIGLALGQVRAGAYGSASRRAYGVIGDDVVLAARLMTAAPPGEIRCAHSIYRQTRSKIAFEGLRPARVKGKAGKIRLYRPLGQQPTTSERSTLVGRQDNVAQLKAALDTIQAGGTRVLTVEGEAGIGKSRLIEEMARIVSERGFISLIGSGQSIEQQTPYRAWREVFNAYFDIDDVLDPTERRQRVQATLLQWVPEQMHRFPLLNDVLNLDVPENELSASLDPVLRQQSLTLLLTSLLQVWASEQPLIVVLEDAHWLDSLSWSLALQSARSLALSAAPFLLVVVHRPLEKGPPGRPILEQLRGLEISQTIQLAGLSPDEIANLLANRLNLSPKGIPSPLAELVQTRAEGNPFFAQELIFALRDRGVIMLEPGDKRLRILSDLDRARQTLPDTLHGLILARIDRLPPEHQLTLKVAAVIGRAFAYVPLRHTITQYAAVVERALKNQLDDLAQHDFTTLEAPEPDLSYIFKHIIVQEAAYQTLLFSQRRQLHQAVAEWYEETFGPASEPSPLSLTPYLPLLVHHYHRAEDRAKERQYAKLAGRQAVAQFANAEAIRYLSRALELTGEDDLAERYALSLARERVYDLQGKRQAQNSELTSLAKLAQALNDTKRQAEAALRRANYAEAIGDYDQAITDARHSIRLAEAPQDVASEAQGYLAWGLALFRQWNWEASQAQLEQALTLAHSSENGQIEVDSLRNLGRVCWVQDDYAGARSYWRQSLNLYRRLGDRRGEAGTLNNLGLVADAQSDYARATRYYQQSLRIKQEIGDRLGEGRTLNNLGAVGYLQGDYAGARRYWEQSLRIRREVGDRQGESYTLINLCGVAHNLDTDETAREYGQEALRIAQELGDRSSQGAALTGLGRALAGLGQLAEATEAYQAALAIKRELAQENFVIECLAGLAHVSLIQQKPAQAQRQVEQILNYLETNSLTGLAEPFWIHWTCYQVLRTNDDPRAQKFLNNTHALLQEKTTALPDEASRRTFLEKVSVHRDIVTEFERFGE